MSARDEVQVVVTDRQVVPLGATVAVFMEPVARQNSWALKLASGGTLEIIGVTDGTTLTAAALATASGTHYTLGASEVLSLSGASKFYLSATSATCVAHVIRGLSPG